VRWDVNIERRKRRIWHSTTYAHVNENKNYLVQAKEKETLKNKIWIKIVWNDVIIKSFVGGSILLVACGIKLKIEQFFEI
jgi:hypothetical protein